MRREGRKWGEDVAEHLLGGGVVVAIEGEVCIGGESVAEEGVDVNCIVGRGGGGRQR